MRTLTKLGLLLGIAFLVMNCSNNKNEKNTEIKTSQSVSQQVKPASLFIRLGGEKGIAAIVDDIFETHMKNPVVNHLTLPLLKNPEHFAKAKKNIRDFLSSGTGGKAKYSGKDLPTAHKGMNITEKEFLSAVDDIMLVLNNHKIDEQSKKDMLYTLYSLKDLVLYK
ncbi:MAG: group I truncated hemoglobin [Lutibacter sp.]